MSTQDTVVALQALSGRIRSSYFTVRKVKVLFLHSQVGWGPISSFSVGIGHNSLRLGVPSSMVSVYVFLLLNWQVGFGPVPSLSGRIWSCSLLSGRIWSWSLSISFGPVLYCQVGFGPVHHCQVGLGPIPSYSGWVWWSLLSDMVLLFFIVS